MALTPTEEAQTRQLLAQQAPILSLADNEATIISKLGATKVNLSSLGSAVTFDDADIMLIRQGTTDLSIAGSVVKAAVGVPDASETVKGKVELATSAETIAGTDNTRAVHPAGLASLTSTESRAGLIEVATQAENDAGALDTRAVTPLKLRNGFAISLTANGYIKLPSWLSGLVIQWGLYNNANAYLPEGAILVTMPIAFPNAALFALATGRNSGGAKSGGSHAEVANITTTQINVFVQANAAGSTTNGVYWLAIGN